METVSPAASEVRSGQARCRPDTCEVWEGGTRHEGERGNEVMRQTRHAVNERCWVYGELEEQ